MDAAIAFMQMMIWVTLLWIGYRLDRLEGRPKSTSIPQLFDLTVKAVKARKIRNMNKAPIVPDVDDAMMKRFYRKLYEIHNSGREYDMTEEYWYPDIWQGKEIGGASKEQMRNVFARAEAAGVLKRRNQSAKNSTRVLSSYATLRRMADTK